MVTVVSTFSGPSCAKAGVVIAIAATVAQSRDVTLWVDMVSPLIRVFMAPFICKCEAFATYFIVADIRVSAGFGALGVSPMWRAGGVSPAVFVKAQLGRMTY
jgi:hypothetical protein